jgi:hypothetical protein
LKNTIEKWKKSMEQPKKTIEQLKKIEEPPGKIYENQSWKSMKTMENSIKMEQILKPVEKLMNSANERF